MAGRAGETELPPVFFFFFKARFQISQSNTGKLVVMKPSCGLVPRSCSYDITSERLHYLSSQGTTLPVASRIAV